jgi:acyl-coenzyme A thioesterase PaaI-like protein
MTSEVEVVRRSSCDDGVMTDHGEEVRTDEATALLHAGMSLTETLGMRAISSRPDSVEVDLDWSPELLTGGGLLHGGAVMALADAAGGLTAFLNLPTARPGRPPSNPRRTSSVA